MFQPARDGIIIVLCVLLITALIVFPILLSKKKKCSGGPAPINKITVNSCTGPSMACVSYPNYPTGLYYSQVVNLEKGTQIPTYIVNINVVKNDTIPIQTWYDWLSIIFNNTRQYYPMLDIATSNDLMYLQKYAWFVGDIGLFINYEYGQNLNGYVYGQLTGTETLQKIDLNSSPVPLSATISLKIPTFDSWEQVKNNLMQTLGNIMDSQDPIQPASPAMLF